MTLKEAVDGFNHLLGDIADNHLFVGTINPEFVKMAISALEKQVPKQYVMDVGEATCPGCSHELEQQRMIGDNVIFHEQYEYCPGCGQRIDWGGAGE